MSAQTTAAARRDGFGGFDSESEKAAICDALAKLADYWSVSKADAARLVGVSDTTWARMRENQWNGQFSQDQLMRASGLIGLYKALHLYFSDELADRWPRMENDGPLFGGHSPIEVMLVGGIPSIIETRKYVDALRGGV